jgi:hypothetical protein
MKNMKDKKEEQKIQHTRQKNGSDRIANNRLKFIKYTALKWFLIGFS